MFQEGRQSPCNASDRNLLGLLSLQLLLLAFFILLTSISKFETERAHIVLASIQDAFSMARATSTGELASGADDLVVIDRVANKLGDLAASFVPLARVKVADASGLMRLDLPADILLRPGEAAVTPAAAALMARIVGLLDDLGPEFRYEIKLLLTSRAAGAADVARAVALARAQIAAGAPGTSVAAGLVDGKSSNVGIVLRLLDDRSAAAEGSAVGADR